MRNKYAGVCYRCGETVQPGEGHFERFKSGWRTQHAACAIKFRGTPDPERAAYSQQTIESKAKGTGRRAQRARATLRAALAIPQSTEPSNG